MKRIIKRKRKKIIRNIKGCLWGILLVVLIFKGVMVDAGINDSHIEKNRVEGVYAVTNFMGSDHLYYLNMYTLNGVPAYCIELGIDITNDIYNSTYDFSISNLNSKKIDYIRNVSYFGYGYLNHNDYRYYMAVQEIMWEYLNNIEVDWTNVLDVNGERINIDSYKNEILNLVKDYEKGINLDNYTNGMDVRIGDIVKLSDVNENLEYYEVISSEHNTVNVVGNDIYIKFDTDYIGSDSIVLKRKKIYENDSLLYYQGSSQKLISNGNVEDEIKINFNIKGKSMFIQLYDSIKIKHNNQFDYGGFKFQLYDDNNKFVDNVISDKYGRIIIDDLPYGNYVIRQTLNSPGYLNANNSNKIEFFSDDIVNVGVIPLINDIRITKLYGEGDNLFRESGVEFDVYNIDGSYYDSVVTDEYGLGNIKLPYGEYIVKQRTSSYGYMMVDDFKIVNKSQKTSVDNYTLIDEIIKCNLIVNTKDMEGNFILEDGFSYKLYKDNVLLEFNGVSEFKSVDGNVLLPGELVYGDYVLEIIDNNVNYKNSVKKIDFSINNNSEFMLNDGKLIMVIDVNYDVVKGSVKVNTLKEVFQYSDNSYFYEYVKDSDVKLDLLVDSEIVINNNIIYNKGDKVRDVVTDNNGEVLINDLYLGNYCLVNDYYKDCFEIFDENTVMIRLSKSLDKGKVSIHNVSSDGLDIMGTVMELYDKDDRVIYIGSTNDIGMIKISDLMYGEYCFRQKSVESEYLLNKDDVCFVIDSEKNIELEVVNKRIDRKIVIVPDTFSDKKSVRKLILLVFMLIVGGIVYKIKISNRSN